ncbi:hypothetical protein Syun_017785 [Stephania yunnanensis]|uniref:Protein SMG7 n=1 Tax=Stephania yunnanensis TaxID=152371 RepID=A0AAP0J9V6_9MAGN
MMTVPMDNGSAPASRELVEFLYQKNKELDNNLRKLAQAKFPSDPNAFQQMRENYEAIILEDHAFSEKHEVEVSLWQLHHKKIDELRQLLGGAVASTGSAAPQSGKSPTKAERIMKIRSQFKTFLSEATGFYHDLILKIRAKYGVPLDHFPEDVENQVTIEKDGNKSAMMKKGLRSCHRCLIYLGDLARYKCQFGEGDSRARDYAAASSYYMQAASLSPLSGNPHHQLAILALYSGDELLTVYRYFRSLAVNSPFSTARDNLILAFEKNRQSYSLLLGGANSSSVKSGPVRKIGKGRGKGETLVAEDTKVEANSIKGPINIRETCKTFSIRFVRLNGILFTRTSLETFEEVLSLVISDLHLLLSSGPLEELNFGSDIANNGLVIVRHVAILIFTVHNVNRETEGQSYAEILQRSVLFQNACTAAFRFMGFIVERCMQLQDPSLSYLLPGILVFVEWLACRPDMAVNSDAEEKQVAARAFFWKQFVSFLNKLMLSKFASNADDEDEFFNMSRYDEGETGNRLALPEDVELRGFLPLVPAQLILDFSRKNANGSDGGNKEKRARIQRILAAGRALTSVVQIDQKGMYFDQKLKKFVIGVKPQIAEDFAFSMSPEKLTINGTAEENPGERTNILGSLAPKDLENVEDEDEVIVFKPSISDRVADTIGLKMNTYDVLGPDENSSKGEWASYIGSTSPSLNNISLQNTPDVTHQTLPSFPEKLPQQLLSMNPVGSNWIVEQEKSIANGIKSLGITGNGFSMNTIPQDGLRPSQPSALSIPFPQPANLTAYSMLPSQTKFMEAEIPSKFDSIMHLGTTAESLTSKQSTACSTSLKKNPVSRPARHHGPPPGFSPVPSKPFDESVVGSDLKNDILPVDDYSWLDGYQLPSSTKVSTVNNSVNHATHLYPHAMSNISTMTDTISFPFPGKQASSVQLPLENQKTWSDYQVFEHLKLYQEQQQQLQQANQWSAPLPEQYHGQPMWPGRFFV